MRKLRDPIKQIQGNILVSLIVFIVKKEDIILEIVSIRMKLMC